MQVMVSSTLGVPLVNYYARFRDLFSMEKLLRASTVSFEKATHGARCVSGYEYK